MSTKWTTANIPDQTGTVVIITGANSGIGYEAARALAAKNATVVLAVRSMDKGQAAVDTIRNESPRATLDLMHLDLANLESVRGFAADFTAKYDQLHYLVNNAGVMALPARHETANGFEMQFGTNHLGHFALTGLLLGTLLHTPGSRVVTVSSGAHNTGQINFDDLQQAQNYGPWRAYGQSKLANLLFTYELQRKLAAAGASTRATAAHPGYTATNLQQHSGFFSFLNPIMAQPQDMGALPTLYAMFAPAQGGEYYGPDGFMEMRGYPKQVDSNDRSKDTAVAARLWAVSEDLTGVRYTALAPVTAAS